MRSKSIDGWIVQGEARRTTSRSLAENERKRGESSGIIREMRTANNFLVGPPSISVPELAFHRVSSHESLALAFEVKGSRSAGLYEEPLFTDTSFRLGLPGTEILIVK